MSYTAIIITAVAFPLASGFSAAVAMKSSSIVLSDTKALQEWDVDRYQSQHSFVWEYGASLVDIARPAPGERILDIGCGSGELTFQLAERAAAAGDDGSSSSSVVAVRGIDADPSMVDKAAAQYPNLEFAQDDIRTFEVDEPVDLLFSNAALHWVPEKDMDEAVQSIARAIRPGGRFVAEFGGKGNVANIVGACQQVLDETKGIASPCPWCFPSISEFTTLLERHRIEVTSAELYDRPTVLGDGNDGMSNWIRMFGSYFLVHHENEEAVATFLDAVMAKLRPLMFDGEQWTADYRRIRIVGRKLD